MANKFVIFPVGKLAEAQAYKAFGDAWVQVLQSEPGAQLGLLSTDAYGQHVTTYAGPPYIWTWERGEEPEPEGGPAMRADGVLHENWVRPPEEE